MMKNSKRNFKILSLLHVSEQIGAFSGSPIDTAEAQELEEFFRKSGDTYPFNSSYFDMRYQYVSWFSFYRHDNNEVLIFPFTYSPVNEKYLVYRENGYRMYSASEIMNLVRFNAI